MKTLVLGRGFLGKEFERQGYEVWNRHKFDFDGYGIHYHPDIKNYDVIINCIAKSNTRWCEENFKEAMMVNGDLPKELSEFCNFNGKKYVHISTGCLYDRTDIKNKETDFIVAHCNYTVTKWVGEIGCDHESDLILRPRLLYSDVPDRNNLLCKLPNFPAYTTHVKDSLTSTKTIVEATQSLLEAGQTGIFNIANEGSATMHMIADWCGLNPKPTTIEEIRDRAGLYLVNNVMSLDKLNQFYRPETLEKTVKSYYNILNETRTL